MEGSGRRGRILPEDVANFAKAPAAATAAAAPPGAAADGAALGLLPWPKIDFSKFGAVEIKPLARIKKISGGIPHVTNHDECDIADLEEFRNRLNKKNEKSGVRVSMLAFRIKAAVGSLKKFPEFNASLDDNNLILKNTTTSGSRPQGLVVPSSATQTRRASLRSPRRWATSPSSRAMAS